MKPNTLLAFVGGALAGAALALLYAPDKGENTRRKILSKAEEIKDNVHNRAEDEYHALKNKFRKAAAETEEQFERTKAEAK